MPVQTSPSGDPESMKNTPSKLQQSWVSIVKGPWNGQVGGGWTLATGYVLPRATEHSSANQGEWRAGPLVECRTTRRCASEQPTVCYVKHLHTKEQK